MAFVLGFANNETDRVVFADGTGLSFKLGKIVGATITNLFTFADSGVLTVASGITISAFSVAGVVHNTSAGVLTTGQVVAAEIASVNWSVVLGTPTTLSGYGITDAVSASRTVVGGAGLTASGGPLGSSNVTLNVVANADGSIVVNADDIQVGVLATDAQHGNRGGGALHVAVSNAVAGFAPAISGSNRIHASTNGTSSTWTQVVDAMVSDVSFAKVTGRPTTLSGYGITDAVPNTRTLTGTAPITIAGDNAAHDLSVNRTIAVSNADTSNVGVLRLANDFAGTATAPTVVQLTGAAGTVAVLASNFLWGANVSSPSIKQTQSTFGAGFAFQIYAQQGHAGSRGGTLQLGGGPGGTSGTNLAGDVQFDLGVSVSNASAHLTAFSDSFTVLDVARTALNTVTVDTNSLATFLFNKPIGIFADAGSGGGPNSGEYSLAVGNSSLSGKDKVFMAVGGGQPVSDSTPRYYFTVAPGTNDVTSNTPVSALATVHIGQQTFHSITDATRSVSGPLATLLIDDAPSLTGAFWAGGQATYALYVASGVAHFGGGVEFASNSFLVGAVGSAPLFIDSLGQVFLGDGTNEVRINGGGGITISPATTTTSASSGTAFALPGNPHGYLKLRVGSLDVVFPFWLPP